MGPLAAGATERGCCRALRAHHAVHPGSRHRPPAVTLDRAMQPWLLGLGVQQFRGACRCRQIILIMGAHFAGAVGFALRHANTNGTQCSGHSFLLDAFAWAWGRSCSPGKRVVLWWRRVHILFFMHGLRWGGHDDLFDQIKKQKLHELQRGHGLHQWHATHSCRGNPHASRLLCRVFSVHALMDRRCRWAARLVDLY